MPARIAHSAATKAGERSGLDAFIRRLPKIELHLHLEGSIPAPALARLAARRGLPVPPAGRFTDFTGFLKAFGAVCDLLVERRDFEAAARAVIVALRRQRVRHAEILFSPQVFLRRGVPLACIMEGLLAARRREARRGPPSVLYVMDGVRQWGPAWFERVVRGAAPWAGRGLAAVGLGGDERALPAAAFRRAFDQARRLGLAVVMHAGEVGGPGGVREALALPGVRRIGHGIGAARDPRLVRALVRRRLPLEVCPTSNIRTGAVAAWDRHPVRRLADAGVRLVAGSDDGALFGTDLTAELGVLARRYGFGRKDLVRLMLNAAGASLLPAQRRAALRREILARA